MLRTLVQRDSFNLSSTITQCQTNSTFFDSNANCPCLVNGTLTEMNPDVSGPGVRISFYLQAFFLSVLAARSDRVGEINSALYTLTLTNVAMAVTTLVLGFQPTPRMSFQDALVVIYLLALSWTAVMSTLPMYNRYLKVEPRLQVFAVVQTLIIFAFCLAVLITADTFGSSPLCNDRAKFVIFAPFKALPQGRIVASVILGLVSLFYGCMTYEDYKESARKSIRESVLRFRRFIRSVVRNARSKNLESGERRDGLHTSSEMQDTSISSASLERNSSSSSTSNVAAHKGSRGLAPKPYRPHRSGAKHLVGRAQSHHESRHKHKPQRVDQSRSTLALSMRSRDHHSFDMNISGSLIVQLIVIIVLWAMFVLNTELLIRANLSESGEGNSWQFGQVLPMFLVLLPLVGVVRAFREHGFRKKMHVKHVHYGPQRKRRKHRKGQRYNQPSSARHRSTSGTSEKDTISEAHAVSLQHLPVAGPSQTGGNGLHLAV